MNPRYREIHRAGIMNRMRTTVDRCWGALNSSLALSILFVASGIEFWLVPRSGSVVIGALFAAIGILMFIGHRRLHRKLRNQKYAGNWLEQNDQLTIVALLCFAFVLSRLSTNIGYVIYFMVSMFACWRLWKSSQPHWQICYFRAGRQYFRDLYSYLPKNTANRTSQKATQFLPEHHMENPAEENLQISKDESIAMEDTCEKDTTFRYCTVELSAFSLVCISALSAGCGGLMLAIILIVSGWLGISGFIQASGAFASIIFYPLLATALAGIGAIIGYPIYRWICKKSRGQRMTGIFHNPHG